MPAAKQAPNIKIKARMWERKLSVTTLAKTIGHARSTVSRAINHGQNSGVLLKVKEALGV